MEVDVLDGDGEDVRDFKVDLLVSFMGVGLAADFVLVFVFVDGPGVGVGI